MNFPLRNCKTGNKDVSFVLQHCCKTSWKVMLRVLPPGFKPLLQQIRLFQVAKSCCKKQRVVLFLQEKFVHVALAQGKLVLQQVTKRPYKAWQTDNYIQKSVFSQLATSFVVKGLNVGGKTHSSKGTDSLYQCYFLVVCEPLNNSSRSLIPFTADVFTVKTKQSTILTTSSNLELK